MNKRTSFDFKTKVKTHKKKIICQTHQLRSHNISTPSLVFMSKSKHAKSATKPITKEYKIVQPHITTRLPQNTSYLFTTTRTTTETSAHHTWHWHFQYKINKWGMITAGWTPIDDAWPLYLPPLSVRPSWNPLQLLRGWMLSGFENRQET